MLTLNLMEPCCNAKLGGKEQLKLLCDMELDHFIIGIGSCEARLAEMPDERITSLSNRTLSPAMLDSILNYLGLVCALY